MVKYSLTDVAKRNMGACVHLTGSPRVPTALMYNSTVSLRWEHTMNPMPFATGMIVEDFHRVVPILTPSTLLSDKVDLISWYWDPRENDQAELIVVFSPHIQNVVGVTKSGHRMPVMVHDPSTGKMFYGESEHDVISEIRVDSYNNPTSFNDNHQLCEMFMIQFVQAELIQPSLREIL